MNSAPCTVHRSGLVSVSQVVDNLVDSRVDVVAAEHLIDSWLVEIDLGIFLDDSLVKFVKYERQVACD